MGLRPRIGVVLSPLPVGHAGVARGESKQDGPFGIQKI
jgi:hypothetical protein